jgi:hypothetical protein
MSQPVANDATERSHAQTRPWHVSEAQRCTVASMQAGLALAHQRTSRTPLWRGG